VIITKTKIVYDNVSCYDISLKLTSNWS